MQASRSWNIHFDNVIKAYGFIHTFGEACIYKKVSGTSVAFLILYVDDILLIGNDIEFVDSIKGYLNKSFSMKDLGEHNKKYTSMMIRVCQSRSHFLSCMYIHDNFMTESR